MGVSQGARIRERLERERGRIDKDAPFRVALTYPSPYYTGMSSLGYQSIYAAIQRTDGMTCERVFLPEPDLGSEAPLSYERQRPLSEFPVIAFSVAYELEIAGLLEMLRRSGLAPLREQRGPRDPVIIAGGPLTFSNPVPLSPFVDAIVMGEADELALQVLATVAELRDRDAVVRALADMPHVFVPSLHDAESLPGIAKVDDDHLPARSAIRTPDTELSNMLLIEAERGCSRRCKYCVMRRSTNGGMRIVPKEKLLSLIPEDERRVGLVGAAVSDHPKIAEIVDTLADRGASVGLSSLRPDRLNDTFVGALAKAGYKTLTTAMDGPSDRLRDLLDRKARIRHLVRAAELARTHRMKRLKLYLMIGIPTETDEDIDECAAFVSELSKTVPIALGIAPFCAKRNTPLDGQPYAGIRVVEQRLKRLRKGLKGRADVRGTSARWAWVEYELAQGGPAAGLAVLAAVEEDGGSFAAYKRAFEAMHAQAPSPRVRLPLVAGAPAPIIG